MGEVKKPFLPYATQHHSQQDIDAVIEVLRSDWWTQGPIIPKFEDALAGAVGARYAVACSSGTAALHLTMLALGVGPGDVVATTANTFLADANCARFVGADVVFTDVDPGTGNMTRETVAGVLEADRARRIKAVIPVHFAGQPVDLPGIKKLADSHGAVVVDDASHALGATYETDAGIRRVGCGDDSIMTVFSFHPVKHVASGEGGAVVTNDVHLADRLRLLRNHGMTKTDSVNQDMAFGPDGSTNPWYYEMSDLGFNYRLTDIQAALGLSQLRRLSWSLQRRNEIALVYLRLIAKNFPSGLVQPLQSRVAAAHAYHLFVVRIDFAAFGVARGVVMSRLREAGIGTQVHYIPVPLQPYYRSVSGTGPGQFPGAEAYYAQALSLPMYPDLADSDVERVVGELRRALAEAG
jgi:UDP-4-amino-4,6-dideoxy-N-acetyl-beta-L-altrosamine transaminase